MINRFLLLFGAMAAFGLPQVSLADKYPDGYAAARQEMNVLGDNAFAGDQAALRSLEAAAGVLNLECIRRHCKLNTVRQTAIIRLG